MMNKMYDEKKVTITEVVIKNYKHWFTIIIYILFLSIDFSWKIY